MSAITHQYYEATIADGARTATFTDPNIIGRTIDRIFVDSDFSGSTLSINERDPVQVELGDATWYPVNLLDGTQAAYTASAASFIAANVAFFPRSQQLQFVSDVNQTGPCIVRIYICNVL